MLPMAIRPIRHPRHDGSDTLSHRQRPTLLPQPPLRTFLYPTCTRQPQRRRTISQPQREKKKGKRKKHRPRTPQCPAAIAVGHCAFRPASARTSRPPFTGSAPKAHSKTARPILLPPLIVSAQQQRKPRHFRHRYLVSVQFPTTFAAVLTN